MENLEEIVKLSYNSKNCLENLGWNINGSNYVKLKKLIEKLRQIEISGLPIISKEKLRAEVFKNIPDFFNKLKEEKINVKN